MEKNEDKIIERTGYLLKINKTGLIDMIKNNSDRNSARIDCSLITMIQCFYEHLSVKQLNWIMEKIKYISRHNTDYGYIKGIKDIQLI
jgi:hypothetical protein